MQDIFTSQTNLSLVLEARIGIVHRRVGIDNLPCIIALDAHAIGKQRVQANHASSPITQNLCVGISPKKQVYHGSLSKYERGHLRVGRIVEKKIERMLLHTLFSVSAILIHMKRQSRDRLHKDADTGIHRHGLHRRERIDILPSSRLAKHERPTAEATEVLRLIP